MEKLKSFIDKFQKFGFTILSMTYRHCKTLLPQINDFQKNREDLRIVAISLDSKKEEWIKFVEGNTLDLITLKIQMDGIVI